MNTRKRTAQPPEDEQQETRSPNLKKIRTRSTSSHHVSARESKDGTAHNTAHTRSGLLTPETSTLTETQQQPCATDTPTTTTTTTAPAPIFPFMKLPAELRIHIYHMALVREDALLLHADRALEKMEDEGTMLTAYMGARSSSSSSTTTATTTTTTTTTTDVPPSRETLLPSHAFLHPHRSRTIGPIPLPILDPIVPALLRLNKTIYREARQVLYSDNVFTLCLTSGIHTLSTLHQRSRSLIKHIVLTIPSHHDILDGFADLVRLGLRYCWGLKTFRIILQASLPDDGRVAGATSVYANAFHILRWLPRGCRVALEGNVSEAVRRVVAEEGRLQSVLDEASYLKRQHQMPERH